MFRRSVVVASAVALLALVPLTASAHTAVSPGAKCAAAKQKAAVKKVAAKIKCFQNAAAKSVPVDADCLGAAEEKFDAAVAKANKKGGCVRTGDATAIEAAADTCITDIRNETPTEPPTSPACGSTFYPTCGGTCPTGQQCVPFIGTINFDGSGGCDPKHACSTGCACRNIDTACNGGPCDSICKSATTCAGMGNSQTTESCCSGDSGPCDSSGSPACCCATSCVQQVGFQGSCQFGLACGASAGTTQCQ